MELKVDRSHGNAVVLQLRGRLDLLSEESVKSRLAQLVAEGHRHQVIDLEGVDFIDSSGLGALISGLKSARQAGGDLRIARPNRQAQLILELTTLDRVLRPHSTVEEALSGYR